MEWILSNQLNNNSSAMLCASTVIPKATAGLMVGHPLALAVIFDNNNLALTEHASWCHFYGLNFLAY